jgi:hypothetical protein
MKPINMPWEPKDVDGIGPDVNLGLHVSSYLRAKKTRNERGRLARTAGLL